MILGLILFIAMVRRRRAVGNYECCVGWRSYRLDQLCRRIHRDAGGCRPVRSGFDPCAGICVNNHRPIRMRIWITRRPRRMLYDIWDMTSPYLMHSCWCAMTLLTETSLPDEIRLSGYLALLFHDVIEDTDLELPVAIARVVIELVQDIKRWTLVAGQG